MKGYTLVMLSVLAILSLVGTSSAIMGDVKIFNTGFRADKPFYSKYLAEQRGEVITTPYYLCNSVTSYTIFTNSDFEYSLANNLAYYTNFNQEHTDAVSISTNGLREKEYNTYGLSTGLFDFTSNTKIFVVQGPCGYIKNCIVDPTTGRHADTKIYIGSYNGECLGFEEDFIVFKMGTVGDYTAVS